MRELCEHGFRRGFYLTDGPTCSINQPDGATLTDLEVRDTFGITGRGTVYIVESIANKAALIGRVVNLNGKPMEITAFESCLILGHNEGHCVCFNGSGLLAKRVFDD